jgi:hypothetical protein
MAGCELLPSLLNKQCRNPPLQGKSIFIRSQAKKAA